jgi:succinoglycan biosynthesis protein ExoA
MTEPDADTPSRSEHLPVGPRLSVIFPSRNEKRFISECIEGFLRQSCPRHLFEVVVADCSSDGTRQILEEYQRRYPGWLLVCENPTGRISAGYNIALRRSRGRIVCPYVGHAIPSVDYLRNVNAVLSGNDVELVGGRVIPMPASGTRMARAIAVALRNPFTVGPNAFTRKTRKRSTSSHWMAVKRRVIDRVGGFDETLIRFEDCDWYERMISIGARAMFDPAIESRYFPRDTLLLQGRIQLLNGWHRMRLFCASGRGLRFRHWLPVACVAVYCVALVLFSHTTVLWWSVPAAYTAVLLLSSAACTRKQPGLLLAVCAATGVVHISHLLGIVSGGIVFGGKALMSTARLNVDRSKGIGPLQQGYKEHG